MYEKRKSLQGLKREANAEESNQYGIFKTNFDRHLVIKKILYSDIANIFFFQTHETYTDFSNICNVYLLVYTLTDSTQVSWLLCR